MGRAAAFARMEIAKSIPTSRAFGCKPLSAHRACPCGATTFSISSHSLHLLRTAKIMRDQGVLLSGRKLTVPPRVFLGAAENPFAPPLDWRAQRLAKKVEAGADFIQPRSLCGHACPAW